MKELREAGIDEVLLRARDVLSERGFTKGLNCDPNTGALDVEGALLSALGVERVPPFTPDPDTILPPIAVGKFWACLGMLESEVGDLARWGDSQGTQEKAMKLLARLADEIKIAVV